jgi:hypothetical protein
LTSLFKQVMTFAVKEMWQTSTLTDASLNIVAYMEFYKIIGVIPKGGWYSVKLDGAEKFPAPGMNSGRDKIGPLPANDV